MCSTPHPTPHTAYLQIWYDESHEAFILLTTRGRGSTDDGGDGAPSEYRLLSLPAGDLSPEITVPATVPAFPAAPAAPTGTPAGTPTGAIPGTPGTPLRSSMSAGGGGGFSAEALGDLSVRLSPPICVVPQGDVLDVKVSLDASMIAIHRADRAVEVVDTATGQAWTLACRSKSKNMILRKGLIWIEDGQADGSGSGGGGGGLSALAASGIFGGGGGGGGGAAAGRYTGGVYGDEAAQRRERQERQQRQLLVLVTRMGIEIFRFSLSSKGAGSWKRSNTLKYSVEQYWYAPRSQVLLFCVNARNGEMRAFILDSQYVWTWGGVGRVGGGQS